MIKWGRCEWWAGETAVPATRATLVAAPAAAGRSGRAGGARRSSRAHKRCTAGRKGGQRADVGDGSTHRENVNARDARQRNARRMAGGGGGHHNSAKLDDPEFIKSVMKMSDDEIRSACLCLYRAAPEPAGNSMSM